MDAPEADFWSPPTTPVVPEPADAPVPEGDVQLGREKGIWYGAKRGFVLTSYVIGPIAGVFALAFMTPTALGLGAGRGFAVHIGLLRAVGFSLVFAVWGTIIGGGVGLVSRLIPKRTKSLLGADRPIRLRFWRKQDAELVVRRRPRRWPWVLGGIVSFVLMATYGVGVYLGKLVDRRLDAAIAAADRDDPHWQVNNLMAHREPVPDQENSALVVAEVVSLLPKDWPSAPTTPASGQPSLETTELRAAHDQVAATPENVELDSALAQTFRRELDEYEEAVRLARTVAEYAQGRHELVLGPTLIDTLLPETQEARTAARLLQIDAALRVHEGDLDGALDSCRAVIGVARSIGDEPFLVSQMVRMAIGTVGLKAARRVLGQGEPSDAALARFQALAIDEMHAPLLLHGMRGERATMTEIIRRIGAGELPISALSDQNQRADKKEARGEIAPWGRLWFDHQRAVALEWANQAVAIARRPPAEQLPGWNALDDEIQRAQRSRTDRYGAMLPLLLMPALAAPGTGHARYQAELGATVILLAAERHRRKTGEWPASADALTPELLASLPLDPFSGRPYVFERRDGRLIVHSIGPNSRDEQGAYEPKRWDKGGPDDIGATAWDVSLRRQPSP